MTAPVFDLLEKHKKTGAFTRYMKSQGVKEYMHFGHLPKDYKPSLADVAMFLYESRGKLECKKLGFELNSAGNVVSAEGVIGTSYLAMGNTAKGRTIAMWLEDVGLSGFSTYELRNEMDSLLWQGWFDANVTALINIELVTANGKRAREEFNQPARKYHPWWKTMLIRIKEWPSRRRVRKRFKNWRPPATPAVSGDTTTKEDHDRPNH